MMLCQGVGCGNSEPETASQGTLPVTPVSAPAAPQSPPDVKVAANQTIQDTQLDSKAMPPAPDVPSAPEMPSAPEVPSADQPPMAPPAPEQPEADHLPAPKSDVNAHQSIDLSGEPHLIPEEMDFFKRPEAPPEPVDEAPPEEVESLNIRLLGFVQSDPNNPQVRLAVLKDDSRMYLVTEGETVNRATVAKIEQRRVTLEHRGNRWTIDLLSQATVNAPPSNQQTSWGSTRRKRDRSENLPNPHEMKLPELPTLPKIEFPAPPQMPEIPKDSPSKLPANFSLPTVPGGFSIPPLTDP